MTISRVRYPVDLRVVWIEGGYVHYRVTKTRDMPIAEPVRCMTYERFREIIDERDAAVSVALPGCRRAPTPGFLARANGV